MADDADWLAERTRQHQDLRDVIVAKFKAIDGLKVASPLGSSYVFPDVSALGINDYNLASRLKREAGVLVSPGYQFGARGAGHFRINFSQDPAAMPQGRTGYATWSLRCSGTGWPASVGVTAAFERRLVQQPQDWRIRPRTR